MARIIVMAEPADRRRLTDRRRLADPAGEQPPVLLDERVDPVHLCDEHAAEQLIERLAWAVNDAEELQATAGAASAR
jgi:hypothetical protein